MGLAVAIIVGLAILALAWFLLSGAAVGKSAKEADRQESPDHPGVESLRYRVPDSQDPSVLIAALSQAGYTADLDEVDAAKYLDIACPAGRDRERARVRTVIAESDTQSFEGPAFKPGPVAFVDEQ